MNKGRLIKILVRGGLALVAYSIYCAQVEKDNLKQAFDIIEYYFSLI